MSKSDTVSPVGVWMALVGLVLVVLVATNPFGGEGHGPAECDARPEVCVNLVGEVR